MDDESDWHKAYYIWKGTEKFKRVCYAWDTLAFEMLNNGDGEYSALSAYLYLIIWVLDSGSLAQLLEL